jgi:hypothetical protein
MCVRTKVATVPCLQLAQHCGLCEILTHLEDARHSILVGDEQQLQGSFTGGMSYEVRQVGPMTAAHGRCMPMT